MTPQNSIVQYAHVEGGRLHFNKSHFFKYSLHEFVLFLKCNDTTCLPLLFSFFPGSYWGVWGLTGALETTFSSHGTFPLKFRLNPFREQRHFAMSTSSKHVSSENVSLAGGRSRLKRLCSDPICITETRLGE